MSLLLWYWAADSFPYLQLSVIDSWRLESSMWPWSSRWNECSRLIYGKRKEHVSGASQQCEECRGSQGHQRSHHQVMPDSRVFHSFINVVVVFHLRVWVMVQDLSADSPNLLGWKHQDFKSCKKKLYTVVQTVSRRFILLIQSFASICFV